MLIHIEEHLRRGGEIDHAETIAEMLKARGKDIAFPQELTLLAKEAQLIEVRKFSQEARIGLESQGYMIETLTGQSIASLREAGKKFWSNWHNQYPEFEALASLQSEVAIKTDQLFLPKSNNKTLAEQEKMIAEFSRKFGKKVPGTSAIMGGMADYVDLAFTHLDATGDRLFGEKYGYNYARTNTPTVDSDVASVGPFSAALGLGVGRWARGRGLGGVFAAPLVVPA